MQASLRFSAHTLFCRLERFWYEQIYRVLKSGFDFPSRAIYRGAQAGLHESSVGCDICRFGLKLLGKFTMNNSDVLGFEINTPGVIKIKSRWQLSCWCRKSVPMIGYSLVLRTASWEKNELSPEHEQRLGRLVPFLCRKQGRFMCWKVFCKVRA